MNAHFLHRLSFWLGLAAILALGRANAAESVATGDQPKILAVNTVGSNVVVRVQVPTGTRRLTIEGRPRLAQGNWTPRSVVWTDGSAGETTVTFAARPDLEMLRASADDAASLPLPISFYSGSTNITPLISANAPNTGTAPTANTPGGALDTSVTSTPGATSGAAVVESDIWNIEGTTLYYFNQMRGLQVVDLSQPSQPVLRGTLPLAVSGELMYVLSSSGPGNAWIALLTQPFCSGNDSDIVLVQVVNGHPVESSRLPIKGYIVESRLVGNRLVVASTVYNYIVLPAGGLAAGGTVGAGPVTSFSPYTTVASFDLTDPSSPVTQTPIDLNFTAQTVTATSDYFLVTGSTTTQSGLYNYVTQNFVQLLDISDPLQGPHLAGEVQTAGAVSSKFGLNIQNNALAVVSQSQGQWGYITHGSKTGDIGYWTMIKPPEAVVETFSLTDPSKPAPLASLTLVTNETLFGSRFDGDRLYVVTFHRVDPLWILDLSDPTAPAIRGRLQTPGYSTYLDPLGGQLLTLGVLNNRVAADLFDVSNIDSPSLLSQVTIGDGYSGTEADWNEKAFSVFPDQNLVLLPWYGQKGTNSWFQGVQLLDLTSSNLVVRGSIERDSEPRRVSLVNGDLVSVSEQEVFTADISDRDNPVVLGSLDLTFHVDRALLWRDKLVELASPGTAAYITLASTNTPDQFISRLDLTNYPIVGAAISGDTLYVLQHQYDSYQWATIYTTNTVIKSVPQPPIYELVTNPVAKWVPQPPLTVCTQYWRTVNVPPSPDSPGYTTNILTKHCDSIDQPPILVTNQVVSSVPISQPDLQITNSVITTSYTNWVIYGSSRLVAAGLSDTSIDFIGQWDGVVTNVSSGDYQAYFPSAGTVVWAPRSQRWFPIWWLRPYALGVATPGAIVIGDPIFPIYWGNYSEMLLTFDVSKPAPSLTSAVDLGSLYGNANGNAMVSFSDAYLGDGKLFVGHQSTTNYLYYPLNGYSQWVWATHYYLDVVDFADPASPVIRAPVELPGALTGISHEGNMAYTLRNGFFGTGSTNEFDALVYDGLSVSLLDSIPLATTPPAAVTPDGAIFLAQPSAGTNAPATIESWAVNTNGKLQRYAVVTTGVDVYTLNTVNDLLIGGGGASFVGLDIGDPTNPAFLGTGDAGCYGWYPVQSGDGSVASGLWLPRGDYGLLHVTFSK